MISNYTIDKSELFNLIGYTPHEKQQYAHNSTARFRVPCCGRRFGKTQISGHELTAALLDYNHPDAWYWIVGPNYKLGEKEFRVVHNDLRKLGLINQCKVSYNRKQGDMTIKMPHPINSFLEVVSADNKDSLQGEGLAGVVMAEAGSHDDVTWEQYVYPATSDISQSTGERGWVIFPSTPKGFNWYYHIWRRGQDPDFPDWESWQFPSWDNPYVYPLGEDDPEIRNIKAATSSIKFDQEYGARFTAFQGKIYTEFDEAKHCKEINYNPAWRNYWVFDYGYSNPFVCLDIMVDPWDNVYVWREYYIKNLASYLHAQELQRRENPEGFHVDAMFGDPRGADEAANMAIVLNQPIFGRPVGWAQGIEAVKSHFAGNKLFIHHHCINLIRELHALRAKNPPTDSRNPKEGQHDYDDHACDALRYFFSEYFVLGAGASLEDVYAQVKGMDMDSYFRYNHNFQLGKPATRG